MKLNLSKAGRVTLSPTFQERSSWLLTFTLKLINELIINLKVRFYLFIIYFIFGCIGSVSCGLSLVAASGGYSLLRYAGFSLRWLHLLQSTGSRAQAEQSWRTGLVALQHVASSRTRARTGVPCIGRRILNHCATREVLKFIFKALSLKVSKSGQGH